VSRRLHCRYFDTQNKVERLYRRRVKHTWVLMCRVSSLNNKFMEWR
jgi:hypothetical protein